MEVVNKNDLGAIISRFVMKDLTLPFSRKEYESSTFRQPELYGLPIFVIGFGGRPIAYVGQYIAHKVIKIRENGRIRTKWKILTGWVRILAKDIRSENYIEVFANGVPAPGIADYLSNRDNYILLEDRKELREIECYEEDIVNLSGVMNYEDPVILIDLTGLLKETPSDVLSRYTELVAVYRGLQEQVFVMEDTINDLRVELEITRTENLTLRNSMNRINARLLAVAGALMHYKSELLRQKEILQFYIERLEAVKSGKEQLQKVINDFYDLMESISPIIDELSEKVEQLSRLSEEIERIQRIQPKVGVKKEKKKEEEKSEGA